MRDLMICLTVAMVLGGAASTGRHYLVGQDSRHEIEANLSVPSTAQRAALPPSQLRTSADFLTELISDQSASGVASQQQAAKADAQPDLIDDAVKAKHPPQPIIDANPSVTPPQSKTEMQMVGPDGVVFQRSLGSSHQGVEAAKEARPLAPPTPEQSRILAAPVPDEPAPSSFPTADPGKPREVVVTQPNSSKQSTPHTQTRAAGPMVGPDGVIFRPVGADQSALPR